MHTLTQKSLHTPSWKFLHTLTRILLTSILLFTALPAFAGTVKPSGSRGYADCRNIMAELKRSGTATLVSGKTYYLNSPIRAASHQHIEAEGATIIAKQNLILNDAKKTGYKALKDFSVHGGTWLCEDKKNGYSGTSIKFAHASDLSFTDMTLQHTNYSGHCLEFVACKNVTVDGCKISALGRSGGDEEEMLQIDIATDATAPFLKDAGLNNGDCCKNVTVSNCTITGNRAVVTGWAYKDPKYQNRYHTNIVIRNNKLTSLNREGLTLMNVKSAVVTGNTIISRFEKLSDQKSSGVQDLLMGVIPNATLILRDNTIKGGAHAVRVYSSGSHFKKAEISGNRLYCRRGKTMVLNIGRVRKLLQKNNKAFGWNPSAVRTTASS